MRNLTFILTGLVIILAAVNLPATEPQIMVSVSLNNVNNSGSPQNDFQYSCCADWVRSWLFYKFSPHGFKSGIISPRQTRLYYNGLFDSAKSIKFEKIAINAILDYEDYTHIDKMLEDKD